MARRLVLAAASAAIVLGVVWSLNPTQYGVADVRHRYNLDAAIGLALLAGS
jgi:hypothetical protein